MVSTSLMVRARMVRAHSIVVRVTTRTANGQRQDQSAPHSADDLLRLDQQVCFALAVAARSVIALYRPVLEPMGLTHPQYLVMLALWERSPAHSQADR